jgi:tetratricopeptide (TPR) repeat protein
MAKQAYARGEYAQAVRYCDQLAAHFGVRDDLLNIKAVSLLALGQVEAAEASIQQALKINPGIAGIHLNAAGIYKALSLKNQVKKHALEAVRLAPRVAVVLYQAALFFRDCGDYPQTLRLMDRCLQLKPDFSRAWHLKGSALIDLGITQAAQVALEKSVELDPGNITALSALISIRGDCLSDSRTVSLLEDIQTNAASNADRASAFFSLGNMYRRDGQHEVAFAHFLKANALAAASKPFDLGSWESKRIRVMQASAGHHRLESLQSGRGANLVFIVGMPRSGTTLCEQVLSANSRVLACGELAAMEHIENSFLRKGVNPYQLDPTSRDFEQAADLYLSALPNNQQKFQLVSDKAPMNFERVGLIHLIFPQARFLYCIRHPLDTILSCFMQDFQAGLTFASDLEHITKVYIAHTQLMKHWMRLLPEQIHLVSYEKYIDNQEEETRRVTEFLDLSFEQDMLNPHLQERAVITASNLQVRQAVYRSSIGRWKNYQAQLADVITLLQEVGLLDTDLNSLPQR